MEIKLSAGDKIQVPENCKATIEDNVIIIEEQKEFKDGDILHLKKAKKIVIFKEYENNIKTSFCSYYNTNTRRNYGLGTCYFRHATEEEKQAFFDELKAKGLRWNAETKTMEKIRKRVNKRENYLIVNRLGEIHLIPEEYSLFDDMNFDSGNYYLPSEREQAEEDAKAVKAIFEKRLKIK